MTIKKDLSDLPLVDQPPEPERQLKGPLDTAPLERPELAVRLAHAWFNQRMHDDNLPTAIADAGWYRGSFAGTCLKALSFKRGGVPESDPNSIADHWRMDLGSMIHEQLQQSITDAFEGEDVDHEVVVDLNHIDIPGSMRIDTVWKRDLGVETVEIKTINGFGFKTSTTKMKGGPHGPRDSAAIQGALGAVGYAAQTGERVLGARIVYLSLENLSPAIAAKIGSGGEEARFTGEWFIPFEDCKQIVAREQYRLRLMDQALDADEPVPAVINVDVMTTYGSYVQVQNPKTGAAIDEQGNGTSTWMCNYCNHQSYCERNWEQ